MVIFPWLFTALELVPANLNCFEEVSDSIISSVDAISPPTLTCAVGENKIPLGLTKKTCPLAFNVPKIFEGLEPRTLFRATELDDG